MNRRLLLFLASVLVSGIFLWLALRGVPLDEVVTSIGQADPAWTLFAILTVILGMWARALRWSWGLLDRRVTPVKASHILNIGMLLNQLPLRAGEVARSVLAARQGVPFVTAATSIVVERLIDVVVCVLMLAVAVARVPNAPPIIAQVSGAFGAAAVAAFVVLVGLARYPKVAHRLLIWLEPRLPFAHRLHLTRRVDEILDGLRPLSQPRRAILSLFWTAVGWGISLVTFYALERAVGVVDVDLFTGALLAVALASFSIAIPVSVASIGPFQGAVRVAGETIGMSALHSTTLGFLFHGVSIVAYAILGVVGLISIGVTLREFTGARRAASPKES
ncbi:MAG: flippase-like domain-containing protein [Anaerolineae bacterium]|nr:flippase-like domain-containing protein [Anaerolineae bacterium]NUQ05865.1 flippase-like domain-containing protein [Anaerolineae bacterium]